jgi:hypothetical protein
MNTNTPSPTPPRKAGMVQKMATTGFIAFAVGILVMGWAVSRWQPARSIFVGDGTGKGIETAPGIAPVVIPQPTPLPTPYSDSANVTGRNEGLLIALSARRAIDKGQALGSLENLLRVRFIKSQPAALATVIDAAKRPVTLTSLRSSLDSVAPVLKGQSTDMPLLDRISTGLSDLVVVRRKGDPSPAPDETVARVGRLIEAGRVEDALVEANRMPGAQQAEAWMSEARRYVEARRALDSLERAAFAMPTDTVPTSAMDPAPEGGLIAPVTPPVETPEATAPPVDAPEAVTPPNKVNSL